jgi:hypothetical protein
MQHICGTFWDARKLMTVPLIRGSEQTAAGHADALRLGAVEERTIAASVDDLVRDARLPLGGIRTTFNRESVASCGSSPKSWVDVPSGAFRLGLRWRLRRVGWGSGLDGDGG